MFFIIPIIIFAMSVYIPFFLNPKTNQTKFSRSKNGTAITVEVMSVEAVAKVTAFLINI